jgi:hypothetical protein
MIKQIIKEVEDRMAIPQKERSEFEIRYGLLITYVYEATKRLK